MEINFMQLNDSTYNWTIIYGEDSLRQERKCLFRQAKENEFVIDEKNGIVLSTNLIGATFFSVFEVQSNLIQATYTFKKNKIYFELTSSSTKSETGNVKPLAADEETIPRVYSYETTTEQ